MSIRLSVRIITGGYIRITFIKKDVEVHDEDIPRHLEFRFSSLFPF